VAIKYGGLEVDMERSVWDELGLL